MLNGDIKMSQQIKPVTKIKTVKNHIAYVGVEIEGYWYDSHPEIKIDSSVSGFNVDRYDCDGSCRDNCECYQDCECNQCYVCQNCDNGTDDCTCDSCLFCKDCCKNVNDCECVVKKICDDKKCDKNGYNCDLCIDDFIANRTLSYNCQNGSGITVQCDYDCECNCDCECECNNNVGEVASPKLRIDQVENWVNSNYPDEMNSTTGLHVHLSFFNDREDYHKIATQKFYDYFMAQIIAWGKKREINQNSRFWKRIQGTQYTKDIFDAENQLTQNGDRYTHVNYCYYKFAENNKNGTVEIRLAPVFMSKKISVEYIQAVIDIFNTYLENTKTRIFKFTKNIYINNEYNFTLNLKVKHDKNGLEIFAKSSQFEKLYSSIDTSQIEIIKINNHKIRLFKDMVKIIKQENNFSQIAIYDGITETYIPNMIFMKLANLSSGKKVFIDGLYTEQMINNYIDDLDNTLDFFLQEFW